jgi:hypothetical protein
MNSLERKEITMSEFDENHEQERKQTSGAWVLLLFVALLASIIIIAMATR